MSFLSKSGLTILILFGCLGLLTLSFSFHLSSSSKEQDTPYENLLNFELKSPIVRPEIRGQLGNQIFIVATTLAYAWDHNLFPDFSELDKEEYRISYNRDHFFFRLKDLRKAKTKKLTKKFKEKNWHSPERIPFLRNVEIKGHFQSWRHFHHHYDKLLKIFAPSEEKLDYLRDKYQFLIDHSRTVALHIRTNARHKHIAGFFPFPGLQYYKEAIDLFPEDFVVVVFSDRIKWCQKNIPIISGGRTLVFIEGEEDSDDFYLMTLMKHMIMSNSSFSWWGAYLNSNPDKIVIAPTKWMREDVLDFPPPPPNSFYLPNWTLLNPHYTDPYPEDMELYDKESRSIDS